MVEYKEGQMVLDLSHPVKPLMEQLKNPYFDRRSVRIASNETEIEVSVDDNGKYYTTHLSMTGSYRDTDKWFGPTELHKVPKKWKPIVEELVKIAESHNWGA